LEDRQVSDNPIERLIKAENGFGGCRNRDKERREEIEEYTYIQTMIEIEIPSLLNW
jgi:hypothetical protein